MWKTLAQNGSLILGLAISAYTIYSFIETRANARRKRYALLRALQMQSEYFVALANALNRRAHQVVERCASKVEGEYFPPPASEKDSLPDDCQKEILWLIARAEHLLTYQVTIDMEKIGSTLNRKQIDALLSFLHAHQYYTQVLATRTVDLKSFPKRKGVLWRLAGVAAINVEDVHQQVRKLRKALDVTDGEVS